MRWLTTLFSRPRFPSRGAGALVIIACVLAPVVQRHALSPWLEDRVPYSAVFPSVVIATWVCGAMAGVTVSVLACALCFWIIVYLPRNGAIENLNEVSLLLAIVQSTLVALLCAYLRHLFEQRQSARAQAIRDFETMADHAPGFVWATCRKSNVDFVNRAWRRFTGIEPDTREVERLAYVHPDDLAHVRKVIAQAEAACIPYQVEYRLRRADGAYRWILEQAVPRLDRKGEFEGFTGSGADITATHREREELRFIGDLHRSLAASLDINKSAETLAAAIVPALGDWCAIHLFDEATGGLHPLHIHPVDTEQIARFREFARRPQRTGRISACFARILGEGGPRLVERVDDSFLAELAPDEECLGHLRSFGLVSFIGLPLRVADRPIGILSFASTESGRVFGADTLQLATKIAGIAALALENARLHRGVHDALLAEERARRERELSDRQFRAAWDADIFGICLIDRTGRIHAGNDTFLRLARQTREDLAAGRIDLRSRIGDRVQRFGTFLWESHAAGARGKPFEKTCIRADGSEFPVLIGGNVAADGNSAIIFLVDLTERKAAESDAQRQRELLKTIIDTVPAMVAYIDREERFVLHNLQYEKWLGVGPSLTGRTLRELVGDDAYVRIHPLVKSALAGHSVSYEDIIHHGPRERNIMVNYRPDRDALGNVIGVVIHAYDITDSRRMAADLARNERRYRTLITTSASIVWTADNRGVLQEVDGWEQFTGIPTEPGTCPMWFRVIHPADREQIKKRWLGADQSKGDHAWEETYRMLAADGRYHHVHARAAAIRNAHGAVEEWIGTVTDVTQRVEAEQSLRRKEAELQLIVDAMPALVAYVGRDLRYGIVNRAYEDWFGLRPEYVRGRLVSEIVGEKFFGRIANRFERVMCGEVVSFEELAEYTHGNNRWVSATYTPHRDETGEVIGCFVLVNDITERKQAERDVAELAERYRFLADAMPQNVWTADSEGRLDYVNRRWIEYTGLSRPDSPTQPWADIVHEDDSAETLRRWKASVATGQDYETEHRLRDADGHYHWFLSLAMARRDHLGNIVQWVGTATNIDAQRRAYLELAEARAELKRHADRLETEVRSRTARLREVNEELEAFTYSASHDLRVPIHHIHGFAQAILEDAEANLSPAVLANMRLILNAAQRMDTLIMDLLAYSRLSRSEIVVEPIALDPLLHDVIAQHRGTIQTKNAVIHIDRPLPDVPADRIGLQQILFNLVGNALKFVPPGRAPEIRVRVEQIDGHHRLWVEDNGIGIDPRHHQNVFKLFQRLHGSREYPGTGIGLSLVKRAAQRMGATCGVESAPGRGSRFWVDFQVSAPEVSDQVLDAPPAPSPGAAKHIPR